MVWDQSFESWNFYGIGRQPAYVLVSAEGQLVDQGYGLIPDDITDQLA